MDEFIDFEYLLNKQDDEFFEKIRLHDLENYKLMGYDFSGYKENTKQDTVLRKVKWIILPPGKHPFPTIINYIKQLKKTNWVNKTVDDNRLKKIYKLREQDTEVIVGMNEFDGYLIFTFPKLKLFVLDCPLYGNAIYIIKGDWKKLKVVSQLSKGELLTNYPDTTRITHQGEWEKRLENCIKPNPKKVS